MRAIAACAIMLVSSASAPSRVATARITSPNPSAFRSIPRPAATIDWISCFVTEVVEAEVVEVEVVVAEASGTLPAEVPGSSLAAAIKALAPTPSSSQQPCPALPACLPCPAHCVAAALAARGPERSPSRSEFEARRLAPCTPVHATSPTAKRPRDAGSAVHICQYSTHCVVRRLERPRYRLASPIGTVRLQRTGDCRKPLR